MAENTGETFKPFETDLVVFNPSYPKALRERTEVLSGGILAAFCVRLTADAAGIRDATQRGVALKRATTNRFHTPRLQVQAPFSVGLLAHSHDWKNIKSTPAQNVSDNLKKLNRELVVHPRESLDYVCVADLGLWSSSYWIRPPGDPIFALQGETGLLEHGAVSVSTGLISPGTPGDTVARFIVQLLYRLSFSDPLLRHWALGLLAALPTGSSAPDWRHWDAREVISQRVWDEIGRRGFDNLSGPNDWNSVFA